MSIGKINKATKIQKSSSLDRPVSRAQKKRERDRQTEGGKKDYSAQGVILEFFKILPSPPAPKHKHSSDKNNIERGSIPARKKKKRSDNKKAARIKEGTKKREREREIHPRSQTYHQRQINNPKMTQKKSSSSSSDSVKATPRAINPPLPSGLLPTTRPPPLPYSAEREVGREGRELATIVLQSLKRARGCEGARAASSSSL